jgi:ABC-type transport system substrate-binding protein
MTAAGQPARISAWSQPGETNAQELAVIANQWKATGLEVEQAVLTNAQVRDTRYLTAFPSFITAQIPLSFSNLMSRVHGPSCPSEASRWVGSSWGCYQNPDLDRAIEGLQTSVDPTEQQRLWRDKVRIHAQELPVLPLYFNVTVTLFREGITGFKGHSIPKSSATWNVQEWDVKK